MCGWLIALLILTLINLIRLGVHIEYSSRGIALDICIGPAKISILPKSADKTDKDGKDTGKRKKKEKKTENESDTGESSSTEKKGKEKSVTEKIGGIADLVLSAVPAVFDALGNFVRHLHITHLTLYYTAAGDDPYNTVLTYGYASAGFGVITPLLEKLNIKTRDIKAAIDFTIEKPLIYLDTKILIAVWECFYIVLRLVYRFLKAYIKRYINRRKTAGRS